jgi:hypothetical protein
MDHRSQATRFLRHELQQRAIYEADDLPWYYQILIYNNNPNFHIEQLIDLDSFSTLYYVNSL